MRGDFPAEVPYGYCACGCGGKTSITTVNCAKKGWVKGEPKKFIHGHHVKHGKDNYFSKNILSGKDHPMYGKVGKDATMYGIHRTGKDSPAWRGGKIIWKDRNRSYVKIYMPEYPRSNMAGYVLEHIFLVEEALGWPLPKGAVVHHIDGNGENNKLSNLMVFKNSVEHLRFHRMQNKLNKGD